MNVPASSAPTAYLTQPASQKDTGELRAAARKLEASFISEMLKAAGVGKPRDSFGGGAGEEGFSSFLTNAQAEKIVESGGFGLAEQIYGSLLQREENHG